MFFSYIESKMIFLYGHKFFSTDLIKPSQIPIEILKPLDFYNPKNWSENFSKLYDANKQVHYTNISIKSEELYSLQCNCPLYY